MRIRNAAECLLNIFKDNLTNKQIVGSMRKYVCISICVCVYVVCVCVRESECVPVCVYVGDQKVCAYCLPLSRIASSLAFYFMLLFCL